MYLSSGVVQVMGVGVGEGNSSREDTQDGPDGEDSERMVHMHIHRDNARYVSSVWRERTG